MDPSRQQVARPRLMDDIKDQLVRFDWSPVEIAKDLDELQSVPAVREIKNGLLQSYSMCRIGYNAGTPFVSFNLKPQVGAGDASNEYSPLGEILAVMLACHRCQDMYEDQFVGDDMLANACIDLFCETVGVALCHVQYNKRNKSVRAVFCSAKTVKDRLSGKNLWRYSPSYTRFFCNGIYRSEATGEIAKEVTEDTWNLVASEHYIIDQNLKETLNPHLLNYVLQGLDGPGETFKPSPILSDRLGFYLWGGAGVGKSTFITLFSGALENAFRKRINPLIQVNVVKVPLNSITPESLMHILRIQGISDWSVERVIEQSIAKENIAIIHVEETPRDKTMQERMFSMINSMLAHLMTKYPECPGNVIFGFTSNYEPCDLITKVAPLVTNVHPPSVQDQFKWAQEMLVDRVSSELGLQVSLEIDENARPPPTEDMRPLNNWWLSIGFYSISSVSPEHVLYLKSVGHNAVMVGEHLLESSDGCFYTARGQSNLNAIFKMAAQGYTSPAVVIVDHSNDTIDLGKIHQRQQELQDQLTTCMKEENVHLRVANIGCLHEESDKHKVYGDPSQIRGGLFEFIDDTNNPHIDPSRIPGDCHVCGLDSCTADKGATRVAAIFATVTETGQFMLRELLETSSKSRTHRLSIRKQHVIFILSALPGHPLTPQSLSRAHLLL
uniref:Uncharacterized protein n=1 Tax=Mucochytrium quahogii TaxID=96639 RepID=A0A7S2WJG4_9STRA|mmetsp:Transcript_15637/g.27268  ORF Transcript_15637/g.27268 Transcript_15637/m.27268 type:complete len:668 (-) Transcript_15637:78-2081(-)|eukprot:CAMPEP_0203752520 /NCGR_PEP_ID=MMETSP0098-20131031/6436_1 /ASSEMBLY_ACC=CAM_ASM_000208 /TAXON_ID=96639 /ORGANISM=" , Strain NY0313808BC1" /LENGTH=667 /DNA_ID=CAMNT_0050642725 /DNA_START=114 /DNA_END=2117 /DNA_ORIENTATION=+